MEQGKLQNLITEKNEQLERATLREAESLIGEIANEQRKIKTSQGRIADLRKQLKELNVETLDAAEILGS
jgi:hypothetical protein